MRCKSMCESQRSQVTSSGARTSQPITATYMGFVLPKGQPVTSYLGISSGSRLAFPPMILQLPRQPFLGA